MSGPYSGYHDCPCRDCFEIAIGENDDGGPALCNDCEEHGCDVEGNEDCNAPHAYGGYCGDEDCCGCGKASEASHD